MNRKKQSSYYDSDSMRSLWKLGAPTILEQVLQTIVVYVDTAMVGRIGASASAAIGLTTTVGWLFNGVVFAVSIGVLSFIARSVGSGDENSAKRASLQALWLLILVGIVETLIGIGISSYLPGWMGAPKEIWKDASGYFFVFGCATMFRGFIIIFSNVLRANKDSKTPMLINVGVNIANIILNLIFIGPLGVLGAAIATALSQVMGSVVLFVAVMKNPMTTFKKQTISLDQKIMGACVKVAVPLTAERFAVGLGHVVFTSLVTELGTLSIAAHTIAMNIEEAFYVPGYGMQTAVSTLVGNATGAKDEKKLHEVTKVGLISAVTSMTLMSFLLLIGSPWIMSIFTQNAEVIALGATVLRIVAVSEPLFAVLIIFEGVFHGMGDTKVPFLFAVFTMWGIRILFTWLSIKFWNGDLKIVWVCMVADNVSRCILLYVWYKMKRWKKYF